jgi:hypothetical protein
MSDQLTVAYLDEAENILALPPTAEGCASIKELLAIVQTDTRNDAVLARWKAANNQLKEYKRALLVGLPTEASPDTKAADGLAILQQVNRDLATTEQVAGSTLGTLQEQGDGLRRIVGLGQQINRDMNWANRLLTRMSAWWR